MKYWLTSDTHLNHHNILEYCKRPFHSSTHMDREIIRRWNERVSDGDTVFHLGDFVFRRTVDGVLKDYNYYADQLNGKIILVKGNHDGRESKSIITSMIIKYHGIDWYMSHEPTPVYKYNLHGHVHNLWRIRRSGNRHLINVGVDSWGFAPISIEMILEELKSMGTNDVYV